MNFRKALLDSSLDSTLNSSLLLLDGAMGTMLQASGMPAGCSPERFCMDRPEVVRQIHEKYIAAGASIITTCTFGANPYKLEASLDLGEYNRKMARVAREATKSADREIFVAGNLGPSGQFLAPLGSLDPSECIRAYAKQVQALVDGGVDLFLIETQFDLAEARAIVCAVRMVSQLPIAVSMTFEAGLSLTGSSPEVFVATMDNMGVDVIGTNCSLGPDEMLDVVRRMRASTDTPLLVEPNAGLPVLKGSETVFPLDAVSFAEKTARFADLGVSIIGGCCGTTPLYIENLAKRVASGGRVCLSPGSHVGTVCLTSRSKLVRIGPTAPFCLIGERINPTGKKELTKDLQSQSCEKALSIAVEEIEQGADVLDVNVGAPFVDEVTLLPTLTKELVARTDLPLSLDSSSEEALTAALPFYPASALLNSISGEESRLESLAPFCAHYGAPFILLPLEGKNLPQTAAQRIAIVESLLARLDALNIPRRLILVDVLALTVSASSESALETLRFLQWCTSNNLPTTIGLSNISFGLPARELLNASFLSMAAGAGLTSCIANPLSRRILEARDCINVLKNQDVNASFFIEQYASWSSRSETRQSERSKNQVTSLREAVLYGDSDHVLTYVDQELAAGVSPLALVQDILIPSITEVGVRFEKKEYFLPQLLRSAETMQKAFARVKPLLEKEKTAGERPVIVMATVEGDIHDIGKNIVTLLLSNHGFEVIDCGKDVPAKTIVACAVENKAKIIGLSALMTTTMVKMEETIALLTEMKSSIKVMVGGAAVTQSFADAIGADAYCPDAVSAVREAKRLLGMSA